METTQTGRALQAESDDLETVDIGGDQHRLALCAEGSRPRETSAAGASVPVRPRSPEQMIISAGPLGTLRTTEGG
jgi:hypothetical protein